MEPVLFDMLRTGSDMCWQLRVDKFATDLATVEIHQGVFVAGEMVATASVEE